MSSFGHRLLRRLSPLIAAILALLLSACATPYQPMKAAGGVSATRRTDTTFVVTARGSRLTPMQLIKDYIALKAAEETKQLGGTHFVIERLKDLSKVVVYDVPAQSESRKIGDTVYTTHYPAEKEKSITPHLTADIRMLTILNGEAVPKRAFSADHVIKVVGARVTRG
ncbi:MAG: CC0125/CC1285 family lipoprotein [Hyphomicrobiaceae bacterium]